MKNTILLAFLLVLTGCSSVKVYFCPQDNCQAHLLEQLNQAEKSIYFMTYSFTDEKLADALLSKMKQGIEINGVMEYQQKSKYSQYDKFKNNGIRVKWDKNKASMHHKVFVIDGKTTITGSYNPTKNGNEKNNENMLVIKNKDIAEQYINEFYRIT